MFCGFHRWVLDPPSGTAVIVIVDLMAGELSSWKNLQYTKVALSTVIRVQGRWHPQWCDQQCRRWGHYIPGCWSHHCGCNSVQGETTTLLVVCDTLECLLFHFWLEVVNPSFVLWIAGDTWQYCPSAWSKAAPHHLEFVVDIRVTGEWIRLWLLRMRVIFNSTQESTFSLRMRRASSLIIASKSTWKDQCFTF